MTGSRPDHLPPGRPGSPAASSRRRWAYWRVPVIFGIVLCAVQIALALVRFGSTAQLQDPVQVVEMVLGMAIGLVLFFVSGLLIGLLVQRLLRGCEGRWRTFLIAATIIASPFAVLGSLVGGLLGPPVVILYAVFPYLLLVGVPVLIRKVWKRLRRT